MQTPLFSILIPTFNRSDLVSYAIQSALDQTFGDFEIVVCDNFSNDNTPRVVRRFTDPRLRYIRTPRHFVISDNWEFARSQAKGELILMLGDDDALVSTALERFYDEFKHHNADFLFSKIAEYRDRGFPGPERNILDCPPFSGASSILQAEEFLKPLFSFRIYQFNLHPSAFVFAKRIGNLAASRSGRLFQTNGVEYFAWPVAAVLANKIIYIDAPLVICGRTRKSWGSNLWFCNPGRKRIKKFIDDVDKERKCVPLTNYTLSNLAAEGILTAKKLYPKEFERYAFDEVQYLKRTLWELRERRALGVAVSHEMDELKEYLRKYPSLMEDIFKEEHEWEMARRKTPWKRIRSKIGDLGARKIRDRMRRNEEVRTRTLQDGDKVKHGEVYSGFRISGADFEFNNILGCSDFLERIISKKVRSTGDKTAANFN